MKLRLGAVHLYDADLTLANVTKPCKCYGLTRARWDELKGGVQAISST
ncbi:hypothetical protein JFT91_18185 [Pseudomonas sp. TH08]|nr:MULTISPECIES: hypothetical protein [unclassified Pseudomonas]MBK5529391.1 hypothetical protein [Pseudomonas sp. TH06]MBK5534499.1 hypothetical protein [Pseudomonas sp. TH08]